MQPIERLRTVARAEGATAATLALEAAAALSALAGDPRALVTACRRLVERQPSCGPLWWLGARVLTALDPRLAARHAAAEIVRDPTWSQLAAELPAGATVTLVGSGGSAAAAVRHRSDLRVLVVDVDEDAYHLADRLERDGARSALITAAALGGAVATSDLVVVEAVAAGPGGFAGPPGALAAGAVAGHAGTRVWVAAPAGTVLPGALWDAVRGAGERERWRGNSYHASDHDVVSWALATTVARPSGIVAPDAAAGAPDCPPAPELTRTAPERSPRSTLAGEAGD